METTLSPQMIAALFKKAQEDGKTFPLQVELKVGEGIVNGFIYSDGTFTEGSEPRSESEVGSESKTESSA